MHTTEVVDLMGNRHDHVMRNTRKLANPAAPFCLWATLRIGPTAGEIGRSPAP